jgi:hypothetical protein
MITCLKYSVLIGLLYYSDFNESSSCSCGFSSGKLVIFITINNLGNRDNTVHIWKGYFYQLQTLGILNT